jgi:hypothetical protein
MQQSKFIFLRRQDVRQLWVVEALRGRGAREQRPLCPLNSTYYYALALSAWIAVRYAVTVRYVGFARLRAGRLFRCRFMTRVSILLLRLLLCSMYTRTSCTTVVVCGVVYSTGGDLHDDTFPQN